MLNETKLTKRSVESIKPDEKQEIFLWDSDLKGLGVRISPKGNRSYFVQYRNQYGRTRRHKIGKHGVISADQAREEAKKILGDVAKGEDPSKDHQLKKNVMTINQLAKEYLDLHAKPNKCPEAYKEDKRKLEKIILVRFSNMPLEEITRHHLQLLHTELRKHPYQANSYLNLLHTMFNLAINWGWTDENPAKGIKKYPEEKRQRWLNDEELEKLWEILNQHYNQKIANIVRLLILTGSRRKEVLSATWDQFDLEKGVWTKPARSTKQRKMEHLPLSSPTIKVLQRMEKERASNYLFPGKVEGAPLKDIKKSWKSIQKKADILGVRLHDIRHTHASHLVSSGLSLSIVGKLLGHTKASTTQRYAHLADAPLRQATELFGDKIERLTSQDAKRSATIARG